MSLSIIKYPVSSGGGNQTLQQTTTLGNETTDTIVITGLDNLVGKGDGLYLFHAPSTLSQILSGDADAGTKLPLAVVSQDFTLTTDDTISFTSNNGNPSIFNTIVRGLDGVSGVDFITFQQFVTKENILTFSTGLTRTTNTITSNLSTGLSGGQSVIGGTVNGNSLTLSSTSAGTKGTIIFGTSLYNEANNRLGIGITPTASIHIKAGTTAANTAQIKLETSVLNTTAEAGAIENDGANLFYTNSGATRRTIASIISTNLVADRVAYTTATGLDSGTGLRYSPSSTSLGINAAPASSSYLIIGAGGATRAAMRLTSGPVLTTPSTGSVEYNGTNLFFTRTGTTRENIVTGTAVAGTYLSLITTNALKVNIDGVDYFLQIVAP